MFCGCILLYNHLSTTDHSNLCKKIKVILSFQWFSLDPDPDHLIRIRIPDPAIFLYGSGSREMIRILWIRIRIRNTGMMYSTA